MYYIGLDLHKKTISYCIKRVGGEVHAEGTIDAQRLALNDWLATLPQPWTAAMEAHASQAAARSYVELQLARARLNGLRAGLGHAMALFPNDPCVHDSLAQLGRGARHF